MKQSFSNNKNNKNKAFTLIELLVVIAIIGVLSGAVIVAMSGTQDSATDSRIKASMDQLRSSIEIYGLLHGSYYGSDYRGLGSNPDDEVSLLISDIESQAGTELAVNISESGDKYCLSTDLKSNNEKWCIDSAGYGGLGDCLNYSCDRSLGYSSGGVPISTGLVGYWTMDEDSLLSPSTIRDYSPYGNTGTIYGATFTTDRHGQPNKAMSFDGVDDYVDCGNDPSLNITDAITISIWVKTNQFYTDHYRALVGKPNFRVYGLFAEWSGGGGRIRFEIDNNSARYIVEGPTFSSIGVGNWVFIAGTYSKDEGILRIYENGILYGSRDIGSGKQIDQNSEPVRIGGNPVRVFNGAIDDVRIYNRALSAEEIAFLYNSSR